MLAVSFQAYSQGSQKPQDDEVYVKVEQPPVLPEGIASFYKYVNENMEYPINSRKEGIEGRVYVEFIIDEYGEIVPNSVKTVKGLNEEMNKEGERLIQGMQRWIPGRLHKGGDAVKVRMVLPVVFKLPR